MHDQSLRDLCLTLVKADSELEVIDLLRSAGYWDETKVWRHYGDIENNYATIGNQQSRPEAALVEKLVNSVDARLLTECLKAGINPEGPDAPQTIRQAVARFFDPSGYPESGRAGLITEWPDAHRLRVAQGITLAATGAKPGEGDPSFTIADCGEGQSPLGFPSTLLSLHRSNKLRIPFVQGKFNMGGTGALRFCGTANLQLVLSRRDPRLLNGSDPYESHWAFTVVRRAPEGGRNTVYSYLAPQGANENPRRGDVLHFAADSMPMFPSGRAPYARDSEWGTLIKLYEYQIRKRSHILRKDGLLNRLDLLLAEVALPIRLHECRAYRGHKGSFANNLTGFRVRLEDNKADNLEFDPSSSPLRVLGEPMTATIFAFKKGKADTYRSDEGIIFTVNGQTHGHLTTDFFRRKKVGLSYLRDSILVVVDCSDITSRAREDLLMPSRDRLADCGLRREIEETLESLLRDHAGLRELRERRRREEVEAKVADDRPLEDVLRSLLRDSPTLSNLFLKGARLSNPFRPRQVGADKEQFVGQKYPTYFRFKGKNYGVALDRECHINRRARIAFETDAESEYFGRDVDPGEFRLSLETTAGSVAVDDYSLNLQDGIANLSIRLPVNCTEGDVLSFLAITNDPTRVEPFCNRIRMRVIGPVPTTSGSRKRRSPPSRKDGEGRELPSGISLPKVREVSEEEWDRQRPPFDAYTALRIIHAGEEGGDENGNRQSRDVYDFYVNVDNIHLQTFLKAETGVDGDGAGLVRAQFKYGLVLLGLALIQQDAQANESGSGKDNSGDESNVEDDVETLSRAAASVLLPVIRSLGDLDPLEEDMS